MVEHATGPPESEVPAPQGNRHPPRPATVDTPDDTRPAGAHAYTATPRVCASDIPAQLRRRRQASYRLGGLDCGCPTSDPISCRCTQPPLSERAIDGWAAAAMHVLDAGQMPLVPIEVRRALWRRGGQSRALAELLHAGCGGRVA